jgi:hypothetical protein
MNPQSSIRGERSMQTLTAINRSRHQAFTVRTAAPPSDTGPQAGTQRVFAKGAELFAEGDSSTYFYRV